MPTCKKCQKSFPRRATIDGREVNFQRRVYCLICSPFGGGNRKKLELPTIDIKHNRHKSWIKNQTRARKERKLYLINLFGGACTICGYNKCNAALSFHHRDPNKKKFNVASNSLLKKWDIVLVEALKCDLLCMNCHMEKHEKERVADIAYVVEAKD